MCSASSQPQRVETALFHLVLASRRFLRSQYVRRRRRREFPQVSRASGKRGQGETGAGPIGEA